MRLSKIACLISSFLLIVFTSGCGSINFGGTTHTHFYPGDLVETDEGNVEGFAQYVKFFKERMNADTEPMKDFKWTDKKNKKEEKEDDDRF